MSEQVEHVSRPGAAGRRGASSLGAVTEVRDVGRGIGADAAAHPSEARRGLRGGSVRAGVSNSAASGRTSRRCSGTCSTMHSNGQGEADQCRGDVRCRGRNRRPSLAFGEVSATTGRVCRRTGARKDAQARPKAGRDQTRLRPRPQHRDRDGDDVWRIGQPRPLAARRIAGDAAAAGSVRLQAVRSCRGTGLQRREAALAIGRAAIEGAVAFGEMRWRGEAAGQCHVDHRHLGLQKQRTRPSSRSSR